MFRLISESLTWTVALVIINHLLMIMNCFMEWLTGKSASSLNFQPRAISESSHYRKPPGRCEQDLNLALLNEVL